MIVVVTLKNADGVQKCVPHRFNFFEIQKAQMGYYTPKWGTAGNPDDNHTCKHFFHLKKQQNLSIFENFEFFSVKYRKNRYFSRTQDKNRTFFQNIGNIGRIACQQVDNGDLKMSKTNIFVYYRFGLKKNLDFLSRSKNVKTNQLRTNRLHEYEILPFPTIFLKY